MASLGAHEPPSLAGTLAFQHFWHSYLWPAESPQESWVPEQVSPLPQDKGQESGECSVRWSGGKLQSLEEWTVVFSRLGKEQREQECCPTSEDWECSLLSGLHSLLQGRGGRVPESEGTAWWETQQPACHLNNCLRLCFPQRCFLPKPQGDFSALGHPALISLPPCAAFCHNPG